MAKKAETKKVRLPLTVHTPIIDDKTGAVIGTEAHLPGELVELDAKEADDLVARFGEVKGPAGDTADPAQVE